MKWIETSVEIESSAEVLTLELVAVCLSARE